jgi:hypothetical protein
MTITNVKKIGVVLPPTPGAWDSYGTGIPLVWKEDGEYNMLYQGWSKPSGPRVIGLATSEDGIEWTQYKKNPVLTPTAGSWDQGGFEGGCILRMQGKYWLYYTGRGVDGKYRIGMATSEDLKNWTKYIENPIIDLDQAKAWESNGVAFPAVVRGCTGYKMVYGAYGNKMMQLGYAESNDGLTWKKYARNPVLKQRGWFSDPNCYAWDAGIEVHQTFAQGDFYITLYEGLGKPGRYNIGVAYSPDCKTWARCPENPLFPLTGPNVMQDLSTVHPYLLFEDMIIYYVEVLSGIEGGSRQPHRICAAHINPSIINPQAQKSLSYPFWDETQIGTDGETTAHIPCAGYDKKSFYLFSKQNGTVSIEVDPAGLDQWKNFDSFEIAANNLWRYTTTNGFDRVRLDFTPIKETFVSAWLVLEKSC